MQRCSFLLDRTANLRTRGISCVYGSLPRLGFWFGVRIPVLTKSSLRISLQYDFIQTGQTLFDRFLIMYDLCAFTYIIFMFVFHCTHVRMSCVLNSYLLTYYVCLSISRLDTSSLSRSKPRP